MQRPRYSLGSLLFVVATCGVGFAALLKGNHLWFSGLFTVTITAFLVAALGAMFRRGSARAFCTGALLGGSVYLALVYVDDTNHILLTDKLLRAIAGWPYFQIPMPPPGSSAALQASYQELFDDRMVNWRGVEYRTAFEGVGHLLFSWLWAVGGGFAARAFAARESPAADNVDRPL